MALGLPVLSNLPSLAFFSPEIVLMVGAICVFLLDLVARNDKRRVGILVGTTLAVLVIATVATARVSELRYVIDGQTHEAMASPVALFHGLIAHDPWAIFFKYLTWGVTALAVIIAAPSIEISRERIG